MFDEIPPMTLQDIKETERYGRTDNVKTVSPLTVCVGINRKVAILEHFQTFERKINLEH